MSVVLDLPYPPSANRIWRISGKRQYKSQKYQLWEADCLAAAVDQGAYPAHTWGGPYMLTIEAFRPDRRKRDLDNIIKPIGDQLQRLGIVADDCNAMIITALWSAEKGDGVRVTMEPVT
ncbi:MAG: RusA family crossover junction endodeoxyribonuclease [Pseudomonadota bacterium]